MKRLGLLGVMTALLVATSATRSEAAMITYTTLAGWSAAVGPFGIETFDGFRSDTTYQGVVVNLAGGMSVTGTVGANGGLTQKIDAPPLEFGGFYDQNGTGELLGDLVSNNLLRFDFAAPLTAWSGEFKGVADDGRPTTITVFNAANAVLGTIALASDGSNAQMQFYGFQLTGGDQAAYLTISNASGNNDVFGLDNVRFTAVPEPLTIFLLGSGVAGLAVRRRQRRS
jgi:hypothetical protein